MSYNITVESGTSVRLPTAGKYCDRDIVVTAESAIQQRIYKGSISSAVKGGGAYVVLAKEEFLAEHRNDSTLLVRVVFDLESTPYSVVKTWAINDETTFPMGTSSLHQWMLRYDANGARTTNTGANAINSDTMNGIGGVYITADGELRVYSNSGNYAIQPSNYTAVVEW